jgi:radical SAM protein with 4Fe4S-binding SPASM domain
MENKKMHEQDRSFSIEVTTTAMCNLGCTYCFEGVKTDKRRLDDKEELVKKRIWEAYNSDWFKENYDRLTISFWGGEPTLNPELVVNIIQEFQPVKNIDFHIYTNAYNRKRIDQIIDNVDLSKLHVQVSFDGVDISNKFRITHSGKGSSAQVLENMEYLAKRGVSMSLKSTIPLKSMDNLHKTWLDFEKLYDKFQGMGNIKISYAPTIDYVSDLPEQIVPGVIETFRGQMLKVAKEEIRFFQKHGFFLCTWFGADDTKVHCSAGANIHAINVDGNGYACHGAFYSPYKDELKAANLEDDNFVEQMVSMSDKYSGRLGEITSVCTDCVATTCMVCPVSSFDLSKKEDHFDRWQDRWVNNMCGFFKAFGEIDRSVQRYLDPGIQLTTLTTVAVEENTSPELDKEI